MHGESARRSRRFRRPASFAIGDGEWLAAVFQVAAVIQVAAVPQVRSA
jgi:hypothetical protein